MINQQQKKQRVQSIKPHFNYLERVWRVYGPVRVPAVVIGDPIVRYGASDELVDILLIINGFAALRVVPSYLLERLTPGDCADWNYDWTLA